MLAYSLLLPLFKGCSPCAYLRLYLPDGCEQRFTYKMPTKESLDQMIQICYLPRGVSGQHCGWPLGTGNQQCSLWRRRTCSRPSCRGPMEAALFGHSRAHVPATMTGVQKCWMSSDLYPGWAKDRRAKGDNAIISHLWFSTLGRNQG